MQLSSYFIWSSILPNHCFDFLSGIRLDIPIRHKLKAGLPRFSSTKFHKNSMACEKDADYWQALFLKMTMLIIKEDMVKDCKLIFLFSWWNMYVKLVVYQFK